MSQALNLMLMNGRVINMDNVNMLDMCDQKVLFTFINGDEFAFDDEVEVQVLQEYFNGILPDVADPNTRARLIKVSGAFRQQMFVQADRVMQTLLQPDPNPPKFDPGPGFAGAANPAGDGFNVPTGSHLAAPHEGAPPTKVKAGTGYRNMMESGMTPTNARPTPRGCGGCGKENAKAKAKGDGNSS